MREGKTKMETDRRGAHRSERERSRQREEGGERKREGRIAEQIAAGGIQMIEP